MQSVNVGIGHVGNLDVSDGGQDFGCDDGLIFAPGCGGVSWRQVFLIEPLAHFGNGWGGAGLDALGHRIVAPIHHAAQFAGPFAGRRDRPLVSPIGAKV